MHRRIGGAPNNTSVKKANNTGASSTGSNKIDQQQAKSTFSKGAQVLINCMLRLVGSSSKVADYSPILKETSQVLNTDVEIETSKGVNKTSLDQTVKDTSAKMGSRNVDKAQSHGIAMEKKMALTIVDNLKKANILTENQVTTLKEEISNNNSTELKKSNISGFNRQIAKSILKNNPKQAKIKYSQAFKSPLGSMKALIKGQLTEDLLIKQMNVLQVTIHLNG